MYLGALLALFVAAAGARLSLLALSHLASDGHLTRR